jgi:hypothetical protein
VFGRRSTPDTAPVEETVPPKVSGKGRPTPSRKEAEAARKKRQAPPRDRKEAAARRKVAMRESRIKMRAAMETGEDRYLPSRDQGPVKRYIRDYVDSHRTIGQYFLVIFFFIVLLVFVNTTWAASISSAAWVAVLVLLVLDSIRITRGVKAGIRQRFGEEATRGVTMYAVMRAWQMRRLRMPKPLVSPGDPI